jgi:hypothetical protein
MAAKKTSKEQVRQSRTVARDARLHLRMPVELLEEISQIAAGDNRTAAALVVHVMTQYVSSKKSK